METDLCIEIYSSKFHYFNLINENKHNLMRYTIILENKKENKGVLDSHKYDLFIINRFFKKGQFYLDELLNQYRLNNKNVVSISNLIDQFYIANEELHMTSNDIKLLFVRNFNLNMDEVLIESILEMLNKYSFKIRVSDFIQTTIDHLITIYEYLDKKISIIFDEFDHYLEDHKI